LPTYSYKCEKCNNEHEFYQGYSEALPTKCPKCGVKEPEYHQNYQLNKPHGWTYGEDHITTAGQQGEFNIKRLGKEKWAEKKRQFKDFKGRQYEDL
jgi:putative FmdB family regulatory protein